MVELLRMVGTTPYIGIHGVGVGWGVITSLNLRAWLVLRHTGLGWGEV